MPPGQRCHLGVISARARLLEFGLECRHASLKPLGSACVLASLGRRARLKRFTRLLLVGELRAHRLGCLGVPRRLRPRAAELGAQLLRLSGAARLPALKLFGRDRHATLQLLILGLEPLRCQL